MRLGEKRALQATLEAYQTMLAAAPRLEYYHERRLRSLKLLDEGGKCVPPYGYRGPSASVDASALFITLPQDHL